jgi:hypothetical protein
MDGAHLFVSVQKRGVLSLPKKVLHRHKLDEPGAQVEVVEREDGVIELHPRASVPATQAWFWSERWQAMEREVDEHLARGEASTHESSEAFLEHLDRLSAEA